MGNSIHWGCATQKDCRRGLPELQSPDQDDPSRDSVVPLAAAIGSLPALACRYRGLDESNSVVVAASLWPEMTSLVPYHLGHIKLPNRLLPVVLIRNAGHPAKS
jgi:hypothetical protein